MFLWLQTRAVKLRMGHPEVVVDDVYEKLKLEIICTSENSNQINHPLAEQNCAVTGLSFATKWCEFMALELLKLPPVGHLAFVLGARKCYSSDVSLCAFLGNVFQYLVSSWPSVREGNYY